MNHRQRHNHLLREEPSRASELHRKLSAEMLQLIIKHTCWYGYTAKEAAEFVATSYEGVTEDEIETIRQQAAFVARSDVFRHLTEINRATRRQTKSPRDAA